MEKENVLALIEEHFWMVERTGKTVGDEEYAKKYAEAYMSEKKNLENMVKNSSDVDKELGIILLRVMRRQKKNLEKRTEMEKSVPELNALIDFNQQYLSFVERT